MKDSLEIKNLKISFQTVNGVLRAVRGIDIKLQKRKSTVIVGESGSGKSVTVSAILGLLRPNAIVEEGSISYCGTDLLQMKESELVKYRGRKISLVHQDATLSLDPIMRVQEQIMESILIGSKNVRNESKKIKKVLFSYIKREGCNILQDCEHLTEEDARNLIQLCCEIEQMGRNVLKDYQMEMERWSNIAICLQELLENYSHLSREKMHNKLQLIYHYLEYPWKIPVPGVKKISEYRIKIKKVMDEEETVQTILLHNLLEVMNKECLDCEIDFVQYIYESILSENTKQAKIYKNTKHRTSINYTYKEFRNKMVLMLDKLIKKILDSEHKPQSSQGWNSRKNNNIIVQVIQKISESDSDEMSTRGERLYFFISHLLLPKLLPVSKKMAIRKMYRIMYEVGIPEPVKCSKLYPFELSGGLKQRIAIAIALVNDPELLICDEPTTALDVTIQAQILELLKRLKEERGLTILFITHDLGVAASIADDVVVMYAGKVLEYGTVDEIFYEPKHPYTWNLLSTMPDFSGEDEPIVIKGAPPDLLSPPQGDPFAKRNPYALEIDFLREPPFFKVSETHYAATWLLHPDAPKVQMPDILQRRIQRMRCKEEENGRREICSESLSSEKVL